MRKSRSTFRGLAFGLLLAATPWVVAPAVGAPARVVSMNLCTDQLAMMLADEGQLVSVSRLALEEQASNLASEASRFVLNNGSAEQILALEPDLVLTGTFTNRVATDLLRQLGVSVVSFPPIDSMSELPGALRRLGALLGREDRAEALVAEFESELERLRARAGNLPRARAAFYFANGFTVGAGTLADEVLQRAGFANLARERGMNGSSRLALELLVLERPFLVRTQQISGDSPALANEALDHPALTKIALENGSAVLDERWLVCGTPFVTRAIEALIDQREQALRSAAAGLGEGE